MKSSTSEIYLDVEKLNAGYGRKIVLHDVDIRVRKGDIATIIGPNGAGKTTLLSTISGLCKVHGGRITFDGAEITDLKPNVITRRGVVHCPEGRQIFHRLSIYENLVVGYTGRTGKPFGELLERVFALFPILAERRNSSASRLSGGQQQMLAIGRALMAEPDLLMLDEPSLGLAPLVVTKIFETIIDLANSGITILLVEQNARLALEVADSVVLLESGVVRLSGTPESLKDKQDLMDLYFLSAEGGSDEA